MRINTLPPLYVERAETPLEWELGLSNRESLREDSGMLFIFPEEKYRHFWMKDTYFPLDIYFMNKNKCIVHIHKNAIPKSTELIYSKYLTKFVLETNIGILNLKVGDYIDF